MTLNASRICIAPSVLAADLIRLSEQVREVEEAGADWIHVDVMDGRYVPNISFGLGMITALRRITDLPLDVHLMVEEPEHYLESFAEAGAALFTFHPEATKHPQRLLAAVREAGVRAGLAFNPATPLAWLDEVVDDVDLVLIMSVNPGFGGQQFIPAALRKIRRARTALDDRGSAARLEVDGGITTDTIGAVFGAGADTFVAGSAIFGADEPGQAVRALRALCREGTLV